MSHNVGRQLARSGLRESLAQIAFEHADQDLRLRIAEAHVDLDQLRLSRGAHHQPSE
jgi:hypothetical protein